jgi:hypothetical protein
MRSIECTRKELGSTLRAACRIRRNARELAQYQGGLTVPPVAGRALRPPVGTGAVRRSWVPHEVSWAAVRFRVTWGD